MHLIRTILKLLLGFVVLIVLFGIYFFYSYPVSRSKIHQIQKGMTTNQVVQILGMPNDIFHASDFYLIRYISPLSMQVLQVGFDTNGYCTGYDFD